MDISLAGNASLAFGQFRLDRRRRVLLQGGVPVKLTPKAFDTLLYLASNAGRVVEKDELLGTVWGNRNVEEGNLTYTISTIRKVLREEPGGDRWIVTAPNRGYRFTAEVLYETEAPWQAARDLAAATAKAAAPPRPPAPARQRRRAATAAAGFAIAALAALGAWQIRRAGRQPAAAPPSPYSVAVLPFANLSGDPTQEYFSDGLADELINTLTRFNVLRVAARTSAFSFKGSHATVAEIARALNVAALLEGSVLREGGQVRVNVRLINAATGFPFWSRTYDHDLAKILASQAEIAGAVAGSLRLELADDMTPRLVAGGTSNPAALDAVLRGIALKRKSEDARAALAEFDKAIALDGAYAHARAERSSALLTVVSTQDLGTAEMARLEDEGIAEAERAVALAPDYGFAHAQLGLALEESRFDFRRAAVELSKAIELAPGDSVTNMHYAELQAHLGHAPEAVRAALFAVAVNSLSASTRASLATILSFARRFDEASDTMRRAIRVRGHATFYDLYQLGEIQFMDGQTAEALKTCDGGTSWPQMHCRALALGRLGRQQDAEAALAMVRKGLGDAGAMQFATVYAQWGQKPLAVQWLQTAFRLHDPGLIEMKVLPLLDPIRDDPAFQDIERRMNFTP